MTTHTNNTPHNLIQVEMWSDLICPWCKIGEIHFEQALHNFPYKDHVQVSLRSYRLLGWRYP